LTADKLHKIKFGTDGWRGIIGFDFNLSNLSRVVVAACQELHYQYYKEINSQIRKIELDSQTSSTIVVLVELNYLERILKNSGEFVNETSLTPLKVKYIFGFSNKSWKLVDFVSGF